MKRIFLLLAFLMSASGVVSVARAEQLAGVVLDSGGAPVANARVLSPDTKPPTQATTGADGKFVLQNLAPGFVGVIALHSEKGAVSARPISGGADVVLKLAPFSPPFTQDRARAEKILMELWHWSDGAEYTDRDALWAILVPYDLERAVELSIRPDGTLPDSFVFRTIALLGRENPAKAAEWGVPRLDEMQNNDYCAMATATLGKIVADTNPQLAKELFERVRAVEVDFTLANDDLMQIAVKLKLPEAKTLIALSLEEAKRGDLVGFENSDEDPYSYQAILVAALAEVDITEAERVMTLIDTKTRSEAQARLIRVLTRRGGAENLAKAQQLLEQITTDNEPQMREYFASATLSVLNAIGKTDPAGALALARRVADKDSKPEALAAAARFQDVATMRVLLREAADAALLHSSPIGELAKIALLAAPKFPELADELTEQAQNLWVSSTNEQRDGFWSDYSARSFVAALRLSDKLAARALLEMEWARILPNSAKSRKVNFLSNIAYEMAELDFDRALEMTRSIPEGEMGFVFARYRTEQGMARRLLIGPEKWNSSPGYSWNRTETSD